MSLLRVANGTRTNPFPAATSAGPLSGRGSLMDVAVKFRERLANTFAQRFATSVVSRNFWNKAWAPHFALSQLENGSSPN